MALRTRASANSTPEPSAVEETPTVGEDGLTAAERLKLFDKLPREIRLVLEHAPYNYDVRDIVKAWNDRRAIGYSPRRMAMQLRDDFIEMARDAQYRKIS